jgi:2,3-dihydroxybiphenyl 1,2-dioxygenase
MRPVARLSSDLRAGLRSRAGEPKVNARSGLSLVFPETEPYRRAGEILYSGSKSEQLMIDSLGYIGVHSRKLDDWAAFGSAWLGMELVERTKAELRFRMDDRKQRVIVSDETGDNGQFFGWDVADAKTLLALAARLEANKIAVAKIPRALCEQRRIADGITFKDPAGNRLEAVYGAEIANDPFTPGRPISGFRTGPLGMGHAVLRSKSIEPMLKFYQEVLGFKLTDYSLKPFVAYFMHVNPRHHSLALVGADRDDIHHLMMEVCHLDDVGQTYDMALAEPGRIATTLGRHTNDHVTSFYATTPSDFFVECGWGGRTLDVASWQPHEMHYGTSLWGHERNWLPPAALEEARVLRAKAAADSQREPVQVMPGNHVMSHGVCPWWDALKVARG